LKLYKYLEAYTIIVGYSERNRTLGRPRRRWEDNIKMDVKVKGCEVAN
jgi:hypothetical protein